MSSRFDASVKDMGRCYSRVGVFVTACNIDSLRLLLDKKLDLDGRLSVLNHLDLCKVCRETIYLLSRNRDHGLFLYKPYVNESDVA